MNRRGFDAVVGMVVLVVCFAGWGCGAGAKDDAKDVTKEHKIPLESIYSTNGQRGLKTVKNDHDLQQIAQDSIGMGASNVFLVRGKDIAAAVRATKWVFIGGRSADVPADPEDGLNSREFWAVAYLGTAGSTPSAWLIQSAEQESKKIRIGFLKPKRLSTTNDLHQYFAWVPVGELGAGTYTLELFDEGKKEVILLRRVSVPAK